MTYEEMERMVLDYAGAVRKHERDCKRRDETYEAYTQAFSDMEQSRDRLTKLRALLIHGLGGPKPEEQE